MATKASTAASSTKRRKSQEQVAAVTLRDGTVKWRSWIALGRSGQRKWTPLFETKLKALECRKEMLLIDGELPREQMTLAGAVKAAQEQLESTRRAGTARWFKDHSSGLLRDLGADRPLASITARDIERLVAKGIADGLAPMTIKHRRAALSRVFKTSRRHVLRNPLKDVDPGVWPAVRPQERYAFTPAEVVAIANAIQAADHDDAALDADLVRVMFLTGLRRAELCRLTTRNVDAARRHLWVEGKTGNELLPLGAEAVEALGRLGAAAGEDGLLVRGGVAHLAFMCRRWNEHLSKIPRFRPMLVEQGRKLTPHALRHSYATALIDSGADIGVVQKLMRHANLATTSRYAHASSKTLTGALDSLSLKQKPAKPRAVRASGA